MIVKRNSRNIVIVTPVLVFKYRRDWNLRKIFWEFVLTWKAFLHGVAEANVLIGPILVLRTARGKLLAKTDLKSVWKKVLRAVAELSRAGIEHKELRHPQYHIVVNKDGETRILDFERGKLTKKPRNLSRFVVWLQERRIDPESIEKELGKLETNKALEHDLRGAKKAVRIWKERVLSSPQGLGIADTQGVTD